MMLGLLLALQGPLAARTDTVRPHHDALHHDITVLVVRYLGAEVPAS